MIVTSSFHSKLVEKEYVDVMVINSPVAEKGHSKKVETESADINKTNNTTLSCDLCNYRCENKNILTKHIDSKHEAHKKCYICEAIFLSAETLKTHEDEHTEDE